MIGVGQARDGTIRQVKYVGLYRAVISGQVRSGQVR